MIIVKWTIQETFENYEDAKNYVEQHRISELGAFLQYKIQKKNTVDKQTLFVVKSRTDPSLIEAIREITEKMKARK